MWRHVLIVLRLIFYLITDFVALLLTAAGIAAIFMTEALTALEKKPRWRFAIITACIAFGLLAVVSNQIQKAEDKRTAEVIRLQTASDRKALTGQITTLINGSQSQATSADVRSLSDGLSLGFQRLENAIRGASDSIEKAAKKPVAPIVQSAAAAQAASGVAPQSIRFSQKRVPSADPSSPYGLQVIVQSDVSFSPVGLRLKFTGPIGKIDFFMAGQPMMMMTQNFVTDNPSEGVVKVGYPALGPESPMVVTILSTTDVKLISIERISGTIGASH